MKKKIQLFLALAILLFLGRLSLIGGAQKIQLELGEDNDLSMLLTTDYKHQRIYPWHNKSDDKYYFFLPAYCKSEDIRFKEDIDVFVNGMPVQSGSKFMWQEENIYQLETETENGTVSYEIIFLRSENLPTVFIETDSGSMEYIHEDKENEEKGNIDVITADGNVEYSGRLVKISGRGNSTWSQEKKPYSFELKEKKPLLGLKSGNKWCLLSGWYEGAKLNSKIGFDMTEAIGLESPQCTWIDLYLNGEYAGIYYLTEPVSIGEGHVEITNLEKGNKLNNHDIDEAETFEEDRMKGYILNNDEGNITGGYLIEKDLSALWMQSASGFITSRGSTFTIKSPRHASREQVEYIRQYIQKIDDMISSGNAEYRDYIDFTSFVKKFIIDEIALSHDANVTSMYYYKEKDDDLLYAGPVWDFDHTFGEGNSSWTKGHWVDYEWSVIYSFRDEEELDWYARLYDDEVFRSQVLEVYTELLPYMEEIMEEKIDEYAAWIKKSVQLDKIRWRNVSISGASPGHYIDFDNNVRYLKYFLAKRLNYLNDRWDIDYEEFSLPSNESIHAITFWLDGELIEKREVVDGETLEELPSLDENLYLGWYFIYSDERYQVQLPIYEDTAFYGMPVKQTIKKVL